MDGMGEVIRLEDRRARRRPDVEGRNAVRAEFFFDLASPFTYLAAERVDRAFDAVTWTPACAVKLRCRDLPAGEAEAGEGAQRGQARAAALPLPLRWPQRSAPPLAAPPRVAAP